MMRVLYIHADAIQRLRGALYGRKQPRDSLTTVNTWKQRECKLKKYIKANDVPMIQNLQMKLAAYIYLFIFKKKQLGYSIHNDMHCTT